MNFTVELLWPPGLGHRVPDQPPPPDLLPLPLLRGPSGNLEKYVQNQRSYLGQARAYNQVTEAQSLTRVFWVSKP